ncbi:class I SAM-dependent methyltransferase [Actinoplanes sp. N902-109]|uniref:class I SAM-dependent methyltransferase n=1 Tax=Actinoplanes sp. (strain N902-109) TaxID=649831 RepID=UPI0003294B97|nr:class I SAM-dependent methyltransferase [Actinoplanes sp. N902-109]AGL18513.1 methylase involved in ubiquinone/menaquinone biosynthesis [Actinoplanes sp. N902-109]
MIDAGAEWDGYAATFDEEPDHGLRDPGVRSAWKRLLKPVLPPAPAVVADVGCGTGSLSVLLAEAGHTVRGLDASARMLDQARRKAAAHGVAVAWEQGDAARPPWQPGSVDVVLSRHVLWALPDIHMALQRWVVLLRPGGRLVLVEGRWSTGAGLPAIECAAQVRRFRSETRVQPLTDPALWGKPITDERYLLLSTR